MGVLIGMSIAMFVSPLHELSQIGKSQDLAVAVSLSTLDKLATNDVKGVENRLTKFIASYYLDHKNTNESWPIRSAFQNQDLIRRVEQSAEHSAAIRDAIKEEQKKRTTNTPLDATR